VSEAAEPRPDPVGPSRSAAIAQSYYYVLAAIGLIFVLGGTIAALIALRKWILPVSGDPSEFFGSPPDSNDAIRSLLGALAFAIPGALVLVWHLREARRQAGRRASSRSWGETLSTPEALRSALDAAIVTAVAGVVWLWHLRRGRRGSEPDLAG